MRSAMCCSSWKFSSLKRVEEVCASNNAPGVWLPKVSGIRSADSQPLDASKSNNGSRCQRNRSSARCVKVGCRVCSVCVSNTLSPGILRGRHAQCEAERSLHRADDLFLWQRDPLLLLLASNGCESALLIPLTFGNHTPGALLLAHTSSTLFSEENFQLLQHIADRIAIAVGNADA